MRRAAALALTLLTAFASSASVAEPVLEQVLLSTGGVGYLGFRAQPDEAGQVRLRVPLRQVDDILKSLTVLGGDGQVGPLRLRGPAPLANVFRDLAFEEEDLADLPRLLERLRGSEVEIRGSATMRGRVLAVTPEETFEGERRTLRHRLSVLTDGGIGSIILEEAGLLTFADPVLGRRLEEVLARLAERQLDGERELILDLGGASSGMTQLGYLAEMPLWKASYRLVADDDGGLLQGWAILENLSGQDWRDVEVTLIAGSPTALRQALFQSYFVPRREVPVLPGTRPVPLAESPMAAMTAPSAEAKDGSGAARERLDVEAAPPALQAATARELTAQTLYRLPRPISLATGHTIMAPLVDLALPVERLAIYRTVENGRHPEAGLRLRNAGGASLPGGIATLYERLPEGGLTFLGDAALPPMSPGREVLVGYGLDGNIEVDRREDHQSRIVRARVADGILELARVDQQRLTLVVTARFEGPARTFVVEQPVPIGWRLAEPADATIEGGVARLERELPSAGRLEVTLVSELPLSERIELVDAATERLLLLLEGSALSPELRAALERLRSLSARLVEIDQRIAAADTARADQIAEQERLRANIEAVPPESDLAQRYLDRLGQTEDELAGLARELNDLRRRREGAEEERRSFLRELQI